MLVTGLAKMCGCGGPQTMVRFSAGKSYQNSGSEMEGVGMERIDHRRRIKKTDGWHEYLKARCGYSSEGVLDETALENAAKLIMNARRIAVFGLGNSAAIAMDAAHKFLRLGLDAQSCTDNHMQAIIASHLDRQSVAIGISHSGSSKDIVEALKLSKIGNAATICITNYAASPIVEAADIALFTKSDETKHSILGMSSRIAQLTIFDAIYTYIVINSDKAAVQAIYNTEVALQNKKY